MQKHLPGQHNQKKHGRPSPTAVLMAGLKNDGFTIGSVSAVKRLGELAISAVPSATSNPDWIQLDTNLPKGTRFLNYTPKQIDFIKTTLNNIAIRAKIAGFSYVQCRADKLPLAAFAKSGYILEDTYERVFYEGCWLLVAGAELYLKNKYDLKPIKYETLFDLPKQIYTDIKSGKLTVSDFLKIPHPNYPDVPLFREYTLADLPDTNNDPRFTALDGLFVRKDL